MLKIQDFDKLLSVEVSQSKVSMYNRQALFCAKLILFSQTAADIRNELKELYGVDYNAARGYLNKELKVAQAACSIKDLHLIITSGEKSINIMKAAADYMQKNGVSYAKLFASEKPESKTRAEKLESFVDSLSYSEAVQVKEIIEKRLDYLKAQAEKAAAQKAQAEKEKAEKQAQKAAAQKEKAEKAAQRAAEKAAADIRRIENLKKQAEKAAQRAAALNAELKKRVDNNGKTRAALEVAKKQGAKSLNAKRRAEKAA